MTTILRLESVEKLVGLKKTTIYEMMGRDAFPKNILISTRCVGWVEQEVQAWIEERIAMRSSYVQAAKRS
ncbi:MAG: AlpA family phage regulatory protein [Alphaproteobacteria bacterium]|nr:AlpA family phage regulatory protein [Alphaproteobacteria bacterium]